VKISLQSPKTEFGAQNQYGRVIFPSIRNFTYIKKKYTFGGQKDENKPSKPKNGIWGPSIGNFTCSKKKYTFGGQKMMNKFPHISKNPR
jgi:hypothetical protein